jgi:hypothetical protein
VFGSILLNRTKNRFNIRQLLTISTIGLVLPPFLLAIFKAPVLILCSQVLVGFLVVAWNVQTNITSVISA